MTTLQSDAAVFYRFTITNDPDATPVDGDTPVYIQFGDGAWLLTDTIDGKPLARQILIAGPDAPTPGSATVLTRSCNVRFAIGATTDGPPRPTGSVGSIRIAGT